MEKQSIRSGIETKAGAPARLYQPTRPAQAQDKAKLDRNALTRCINIWAEVYRLREIDYDPTSLQMPSRTWAGRKATRIERFE